jgi:hypothetical protein
MKLLVVTVCAAITILPAYAANKKIYDIPRTKNAVNIDGHIEAEEWSGAMRVELKFNINPGNNTPAPVKTVAYLMEDGDNFYLAFDAQDPEPDKIRAFLRDRDGIFQDDFVGIILDTFNDERRAFEFFVNPLGAQGDLTRDDTQHNEDSSWNAVWDSAGRLTESGYQVEMAIPFHVLRFSPSEGNQRWGFNLLRIYPRDSRMVISNSPSDRNRDCEVCQYHKLEGMPGLTHNGNNWQMTPTLTYVNSQSRDVEAMGPWQTESDAFDLGLDVRWAISEDWIMNATINPDFSQVEADAGQLDINTTFSLFFPETRPFFLDGADYFSTNYRLVHTRNIADPKWGSKITGKSNGFSGGVIVARDRQTSFLIPDSQGSDFASLDDMESDIFIARALLDLRDRDNLGVVVTERSGEGYSNRVFSVDGRHYLGKENNIRFQWMRSETTNPLQVQHDFSLDESQSDNAWSLTAARNTEDYELFVSQRDFGKDFRADLGFISRVNYKKSAAGGSYRWYGEKGSRWTRWGLFGDWDRTVDQDGLELEEEIELHAFVNGPNQFNSNFGAVSRSEYFNGETFDVDFQMVWFEIKPHTNITLGNFLRVGDQIDFANTRLGKIKSLEPYINWQFGRHLNLRLNYTWQKLDVSGGELFRAQLADMRIAYQFNIRSRLQLSLVYTDIERNPSLYLDNQDADPDNDVGATYANLGSQLIYSYKINPLSLFYLGYSDSSFSNDQVQSLTLSDRTLFAKVSYQWM